MSRSWVEIDLAAVRHNIGALRRRAGGVELCAVVKADGYGHGAVEIARTAIEAGATAVAVAQVAEGVILRKNGIDEPIWVLSEPERCEYPTAFRYRLEPAVYSRGALDAAEQAAEHHLLVEGEVRPTVHLKIDSGMGRVGADPDDAVELAAMVTNSPHLELGSVWTHFSCADEPDGGDGYTKRQIACYDDVLAQLTNAGIEPGLRHAANSAGTIAFPLAHYDFVRCGIAIYGMPPSCYLADAIGLEPALSWHSRVGFVKRARAGAPVSYGRRGRVESDTTLASIPVGYADGYRRGLWNSRVGVLIGGKRRPIVGVVTMDQMVVDCGDDTVAVGDEVVLLGRQGNEKITAEELAAGLETINYEITCGISQRVERRYQNRS